jgi:MFS transporter, AAHS family, 3-hydroxyphenylpropionic acid transporter
LGNLGSTLGPPVFAWLIAAWGTAGLAVPVVVLAMLGAGTAVTGIRRLR